jgi:RimJ/RimL family protein N-acetyltransferase
VKLHHPLAELIVAAAAGRFPVADGGWHRVPPWRPGLQAVFGFTGHAVLVLADEVPESELRGYPVDGYGGAHDPRLISGLAGVDGWIDSLDLVLAGQSSAPVLQPGQASPSDRRLAAQLPSPALPSLTVDLVPRPDLSEHPRARYAAMIRTAPMVFGYPDRSCTTVAIVSQGIAGLPELSFELDPSQRGTGQGTALVRDALRLIPAGELVIASVAPGNAASLRTLLGAGFVPLGSIQLFRKAAG